MIGHNAWDVKPQTQRDAAWALRDRRLSISGLTRRVITLQLVHVRIIIIPADQSHEWERTLPPVVNFDLKVEGNTK